MSQSDNRSKRLLRSLLGPTMLAVPGAVAQAANNVASGFVRKALVETPGVSPLQSMLAALLIAFLATAVVTLILQKAYQGSPREFSWHLPSKSTMAWHQLRLAIGLTATVLIFAASQEAFKTGNPPVAMVTVLSSTGAIYLAVNDLRKYHRYDGVALVVAQVGLTAMGFAGILIASWQSIASIRGFGWPILAAAIAGFLLGCLQLVQSKLVKECQEPAVKVVGYFAFQASVIAAFGFVIASQQSGVWPRVNTELVVAAAALGLCYAASQVLLQLANGFGVPSIVGVLVYLGIPTGFGLDFGLFGKVPSSDQVVGSAVIFVAAIGIKLLEGQLTARRTQI